MAVNSKKYLVSVRIDKRLNSELEELYSLCEKSHSDVLRSVLARGVHHYRDRLLERNSEAIVARSISRDVMAYEQLVLEDLDSEPNNSEILEELHKISDLLATKQELKEAKEKPVKRWFSFGER